MKRIEKYNLKVVKNSIWMVLQHCYSLVFSVLVSVFLVRYLGPENYGRYEYVNSIISIAVVVCGMGLSNILVYEMTKHCGSKGQILGSAVLLRIMAATVVYLAIFFLCGYFEDDPVICMMLRIHGIYLFFQTIMVFKEWFLMELNSKAYVLISMVALTLSGGYKLLLMGIEKNVTYFSFAQVIEGFCLVVLISGYLMTKKVINISATLRCMLDLLKRSRAYIIADLSVIVYAQIDKIMLNKMLGEYDVGIYASASYVSTFWQFVPMALINSMSPIIIQKFESKESNYEKDMKKLVLVISAFCFGMILGLKLFGDSIILILYGEAYQQAADYLMVLGSGVFFSMLGCIGSIWIVCNEVSQYSAYRTILGAVLNCTLNYFFINEWGIMGAARATLVTQCMTAVFFTFCFKKTRRIVYIFFEAYRESPRYIGMMVNKFFKK